MVDNIDIKIDEGMSVKDIQISSVESNTEDTAEEEEEQVQASEKEDSESNNEGIDSQQQSVKPSSRIIWNNHPESQIIGNKNEGVQTRRKLLKDSITGSHCFSIYNRTQEFLWSQWRWRLDKIHEWRDWSDWKE